MYADDQLLKRLKKILLEKFTDLLIIDPIKDDIPKGDRDLITKLRNPEYWVGLKISKEFAKHSKRYKQIKYNRYRDKFDSLIKEYGLDHTKAILISKIDCKWD